VAAGAWDGRASGAIVLGLALPLLLLHVDFQPSLSVDVGSTGVELRLSDLAVAAVAAAVLAAARRDGLAALSPGRPIWLAGGLLAAWVVAATLYGPLVLDGYPLAENLVTAGKALEYGVLALATPLLVRTRDDLRAVLAVLVAWSLVATGVALAQFSGADLFDAWPAGRRQPSFLSHHDLAALSGCAFMAGAGLVVLAPRRGGRPAAVALASGGLGLVLAAAIASLAGLAVALAGLVLLAPRGRRRPLRRLALVAALAAVVAAGVLGLRGGDIGNFLRFATEERRTPDIESYSHRTVLAYIGGRIFLDHPALGVGWQGSSEPAAFEPYLPDARRRFPDAAPLAFPSDERRWGVQSLYVQALADLGVVGLALVVLLFTAGIGVAARRALRGPPGGPALALLWLPVLAGVWAGQGLVAGVPIAALGALALGLASAGEPEEAQVGSGGG
jgi:hypothetical protein